MQGDDVSRERQIRLQFPVERGRSRGSGHRNMWRLIKGPTSLTQRQHLVRAGDQMHITPARVRRNPFQLLRRRMTPIHMQLRGDLPRARQATIPRISQNNRLAGRKSERRFKMVQAVRSVG